MIVVNNNDLLIHLKFTISYPLSCDDSVIGGLYRDQVAAVAQYQKYNR